MTKKRKSTSKQSIFTKKQNRPSDVYVATDPTPEEDRNPNKFDVHSSPFPPTSRTLFQYYKEAENDEFEDEEIDEELAFDEEDEIHFSHVFEDAKEEISVDEMDEMFGSSSDEEQDSGIDSDHEDSTPDQLKTAIIGDNSSKRNPKIQSESRPEDVLNIIVERGDQIEGVMDGMTGNLKSVHKSLDALEKQQPLSVPLPRTIKERQIRKAGYSKTLEHISKWNDVVYANRMAPTLDFAPPCVNLKRPDTLEAMIEDFQPHSSMEKDIASMLEKAGIQTSESIVQLEDDSALKSMTLEELKEKRIKLAKMRSLLFHHEIKSRKIKKIKSKEYHRRLQRSIRKKARRYSTLTSEEAQKKLQEEMEFNRIKERMTQKHSTMNRFARRVMRRGWAVADEQTKEALEEQLRQNQELKQKIDSPVSSEVEDESPDDSKTKTVLSRILNEEIDEDSVPKTGLLRLPFMQRAMKKQQEANNSQVKKILQSLDPEGDPKSSPVINPRRSFTGSKKDPKPRLEQDTASEETDLKDSICLSSSIPNRSFLFKPRPISEQNFNSPNPGEEIEVPVEPESQDPTNLSQADLISLAFADDDITDFDKDQEIEKELPKQEQVSLLPGWGRWKGDQEEPRWMQEKRIKNQKLREVEKSKRRDFNKPGIFISEKQDSNLDKYSVVRVPQSFGSAKDYEDSLQHPIGPDCNTIAAFEDFTRPKVVKRQGVIIEPLRLNQSMKDVREDVKDVKEGIVKVRTLIRGEVQKQVLLNNTSKA